jgi:hypothetical protein
MHFNLQIDDAPAELGRRRPECDHQGCTAELDYVVRLELNAKWREARACAEHVFELGNQLLDEADSSVRLEVVRE